MSPENLIERPKEQEPLTPLQERFLRSGIEGFSDQEIIELFLSLILPHRECQRWAKECIEHFKNLRGLLSASPQELRLAELPLSCIYKLKLLRELPAEILKQKIMEQPVYKSSKEIFDYLYYSMRDLKKEVFKVIYLNTRHQIIKKEVFKVIYLNTRHQIIDVEDLFHGGLTDIPIRPRKIVEHTIRHNATALIFAHNHPSGDPAPSKSDKQLTRDAPSKSDKQLTRDLALIGNILQIKILDHIIIGENRYFSFADEGLIQKYEDNFLNLRIRGGL